MELPVFLILPLTGLNYQSFGRFGENWNLKSIKIDLQEKKIHVEVYKIEAIPNRIVKNKNFKRIIKPSKIILSIPDTIIKTLKYFKKGEYSKFPDTIKQWIKGHSGLPPTHDYILALYKDEKLRVRMEENLGVSLPKNAELLEAPKEEWFIVHEIERV